MSESHQLSDLQLGLLRILWDRGEATAADVHTALLEQDRELAPTTVSTMLSRLEKKGTVTHRVEGRQFIYRALVSEEEVRRSMLSRVTDYFFGGDVSALVSHLVEDRDVDPDDVARLKQLLAQRSGEEEEDDDA
ncbi:MULTISPECIES: BlaI/MecI/CopY family transcriptional regulator [Nannocystis]|uniref:BlaI/MecI/CopY family transcriptional regulator n=2 Tax=Nannocystis TaxID=53 RepID=A0ABS7TS96_9BACT|nr:MULTISPECIES: BlaI/MecI/CopY family transcriptional regulator [Nannocystis]MBZ5711041.1 BlaI/MecI/CopY family transcriptional regulator [Nannocystis pusilla]MDC0675788.1 BlaI/MecI/CopY family transcriptional regulator [Nannocystis radixulma]